MQKWHDPILSQVPLSEQKPLIYPLLPFRSVNSPLKVSLKLNPPNNHSLLCLPPSMMRPLLERDLRCGVGFAGTILEGEGCSGGIG